MQMRVVAFMFAINAALTVFAPNASRAAFSFATTSDFIQTCGADSPDEECLNAIMYVEQVVNDRDNPNATCDGGTEELLKSQSNEELNAKLADRLTKILPWLNAHPEYAEKSYGDGVWSALRGTYCP